MMAPEVWKEIDSVSGRGELVFPDGKRVAVACELATLRTFADDGTPLRSRIEGRVWDRNDPYMAARLVGKDCVLELKGRRLSMFIRNERGSIAVSGGVVEGFPYLKG